MANMVDRLKSTGWIWVLIATVAVALLVWWVAAAIDDPDRVESDDQVAQVEQTEQPQADGQQADQEPQPLGQMQGEVGGDSAGERGQPRGSGQQATPERLQQYTDWVDQQDEDSRVDAAFAVRGMDLLTGAIDEVIEQARQNEEGGTQSGEARGGGPLGSALDGPEFQQYHQAAQQSIARIEQVDEAQRSLAFHRAATDTAALLADLGERAGLTSVEEDVERVQQTAQAMRPDQQLDEQSELVHQFFDQSAQAVVKMTRSLQPESPGGTSPTYQQ